MTKKKNAALFAAFAGIVANLGVQDSLAAAPGGDWQLQQLHSPSSALLKKERAGSVTIYDGLTAGQEAKAMDDQFGRIESMMFIRTKWPAEDGSYVEDPDCD